MPQVEATRLVDELVSYDDVRKADIANFYKSAVKLMQWQVVAAVKEQGIEKEYQKAEAKLKNNRNVCRNNDFGYRNFRC